MYTVEYYSWQDIPWVIPMPNTYNDDPHNPKTVFAKSIGIISSNAYLDKYVFHFDSEENKIKYILKFME